jgi:hypothetical protein
MNPRRHSPFCACLLHRVLRRLSCGMLSLALAAPALGGVSGMGQPGVPELNPRAFWVDSSICTVVLKVPIDAAKPLAVGTPVDQLSSLPAVCASNVSGQTAVPGGIRSLLGQGFRVTAVSHALTALPGLALGASPGELRAELLITAIFCLERPQMAFPSAR